MIANINWAFCIIKYYYVDFIKADERRWFYSIVKIQFECNCNLPLLNCWYAENYSVIMYKCDGGEGGKYIGKEMIYAQKERNI